MKKAGCSKVFRENVSGPRRQIGVFPNLALSLLTVLLILLITEAGVRFYAAVRGDQPTMIVDNTLGWKLRPNVARLYTAEEHPYVIRTNSRGLRDKEYSYERPANRLRVIVLGDSFVFGSGGVDSAETFTKLLEDSDYSLQAINMGIPGYSTDQEFLYLQSEGVRYHPDLVILSVFPNDFTITFDSWDNSIGLPKGYFTIAGTGLQYHAPRISWLSVCSRRSYLVHSLISRFRRLSRGGSWQPAPQLNLEAKKQVFALLLSDMNRTCKWVGARFAVVYIPHKGQQRRSPFQDVIAQTAATNGFRTLDLMVRLREADSIQRVYFKKDIHLNARGHQIVAEALQELVSNDSAAPR